MLTVGVALLELRFGHGSGDCVFLAHKLLDDPPTGADRTISIVGGGVEMCALERDFYTEIFKGNEFYPTIALDSRAPQTMRE